MLENSPQSPRRPAILIVDDHAINRDLLARMLALLDCDADSAESGEQALRHCARRLPDLIFMDCHMPAMDGYETTRQVRALNPAAARIPIIALTANDTEMDRIRGQEAGMNEFLVKPVYRDSLAAVLERWVPREPADLAGTDDAASRHDIIDPRALDNIRALQQPGKPDLLSRIVHQYRQSVPALLAELGGACHAGDSGRLRAAAHALASASANLGTTRLVSLCRTVEQRASDPTFARTNLEAVHRACNDALRELARACEAHAS